MAIIENNKAPLVLQNTTKKTQSRWRLNRAEVFGRPTSAYGTYEPGDVQVGG
jgi:hypothetical protein